jgi:uncharacterized membrane protein
MLMTIFLLIVLGLLGAAAVPLAIGIVPPNPYYGWPTQRRASKPQLWSQVNRIAGRVMVGTVIVTAAALMFYNGTWLRSGFAQLAFVILALGLAVGAIFVYSRRLEH